MSNNTGFPLVNLII